MEWVLDDGDVKIAHGDALEQLALMPSESVQCIVTSPPFWGLRDYGTATWDGGDADCSHEATRRNHGDEKQATSAGTSRDRIIGGDCKACGAIRRDHQIGLEETPDEWCAKLVAVMREARRVLRSDGVCWIELGDSYDDKQLVGAPWLLAFALRADGWFLRSDTIWARPNPMPESVTDRPTKAHSYVFLLTKSARYFFDSDAIREPHTDEQWAAARERPLGIESRPDETREGRIWKNDRREYNPAGRNARSVWSIPTEPTPFAHFATFPQALVERCIKAGTSEHGSCSECGAPWRRITERTIENPGNRSNNGRHASHEEKQRHGFDVRREVSVSTTGWEPSCDHDAPVTPCLVMDVFMGSGTTALVARRLGRHAIGVELNAEYLAIAAERLQQPTLWSEPV